VAADRCDRKAIMLAADAGRALAIGALALVVLLDPIYWIIPLLAFAEGVGDAFFAACQPGALRAVVATPQLPAAVGVQQARSAAVGVAGPPIGGALFGLGRTIPFFADAASYALSFVSLAAMRTDFQQERARPAGNLRAQLGEGFRFLWGQPFIRTTSFLYALGNVTIPATLFVLVVVAREHGLSAGAIGLLLAAFSAVVLVGSLLSPLVRRRLSVRAIILAELYAGLGTIGFLIWPNVYVLLAVLLPQAVVLPITDSVVVAYRIALTPDRLLGRVEAVRSTIARTLQPLGPLTAGLLLGAASSRTTIGVYAAVAVVLAVCGTLSGALRATPYLGQALDSN
jgi:MFS family permease